MYTNIYYQPAAEDEIYSPGTIIIWDDNFGEKHIPYVRYGYKLDPDGDYKTLYGQACRRVRRWSKEDAESGIIFEGDLRPEMRYLIDNYTEYDTPSDSHIEMFFDIEVDSKNGLPNIKQANNKITAISYYDKVSKEYTALVLDESNEILEQNYESMKGETIHVYPFNNEHNLLERFVDEFMKIRPTILVGWNIDGFDVPYLYNRLSRLFGQGFANQLSPVDIVEWNERRERYFIAGVSCLDYMQLYKKFRTGERISYSLDSIGILEVKMGKIKYKGTLDKLFKENKEKFIEYNIHDVRIVVAIDEKLKFIDLAKGVCHKGHVPYEDIYFPARYLDGAILTYMKLKNLIAPNKPKHISTDEHDEGGFTGAYVKEPIPGRYSWVVDLDAQSLYPSIIMSLNISPETKVAKVLGWNNKDFIAKKDDSMIYEINLTNKILKFNHDKMEKFLAETEFSISSNGILYNTKILGIIPEILSRWFDERTEYKDLMKKYGKEKNKEKYEYYSMRQYIQKVILNSMYGVLGLPGWRFYDIDNATAVTTVGQDLIKFAEKCIMFYCDFELDGLYEIEYENGKNMHKYGYEIVDEINKTTVKDFFQKTMFSK